MPKASIVIPCHNAERYIRSTVGSALSQTLGDLEVICVDNGSTDGTLAQLSELSANDGRVHVIEEPEPGEGPARDAGLAAARGDWLYFLDSDDLMEPTLLEEALTRGENAGADLVVFRTLTLNDQTGEVLEAGWSFQTEWLPEGPSSVFDPHEHPTRILNSFQNWVHNKVFHASFVHTHDLHMQHIHRTADLLFTCRALTEAHVIALLDRPLHRYRIMNPESAMATSDSYPLDFYEALLALRERLEEEGAWDLYHDSYVNWAIENSIINLEHARSLDAFSTIADKLRREGFDQLGVTGFPASRCDNEWRYARARDIATLPLEELLFSHYADLKIRNDGVELHASRQRLEVARRGEVIDEREGRIRSLEDRLAKTQEQLEASERRTTELAHAVEERDAELSAIMESRSYRLGRAATAPLRNLRDATHRKA